MVSLPNSSNAAAQSAASHCDALLNPQASVLNVQGCAAWLETINMHQLVPFQNLQTLFHTFGSDFRSQTFVVSPSLPTRYTIQTFLTVYTPTLRGPPPEMTLVQKGEPPELVIIQYQSFNTQTARMATAVILTAQSLIAYNLDNQ